MKLSEVIEHLSKLKDKHGDISLFISITDPTDYTVTFDIGDDEVQIQVDDEVYFYPPPTPDRTSWEWINIKNELYEEGEEVDNEDVDSEYYDKHPIKGIIIHIDY